MVTSVCFMLSATIQQARKVCSAEYARAVCLTAFLSVCLSVGACMSGDAEKPKAPAVEAQLQPLLDAAYAQRSNQAPCHGKRHCTHKDTHARTDTLIESEA
jgi:hypothetical protein